MDDHEKSRWRAPRSILVAVALAACGNGISYTYSPRQPTLPIPPEAPRGTVEISSLGITQLPSGASLHVRFEVFNDSDPLAWHVRASDQIVELPGGGHLVDVSGAAATIPEHARRILNLYYTLPTSIRSDRDLAGFDVLWRITSPERAFTARTHFVRSEREERNDVDTWMGWAPREWHNQ